jgi:hypothetical protein
MGSLLSPLLTRTLPHAARRTPHTARPSSPHTAHQDTFDSFNVLVHLGGRKNVSLLHNAHTHSMYPGDHYSYLAVFSLVDRWRPDANRFPRYTELLERAPGVLQTVVLEPGDVLLIPSGWWHAAEALSNVVSLSVRGYWCLDWWVFGAAWQELADALHHRGWMLPGQLPSAFHATTHNASYTDWALPRTMDFEHEPAAEQPAEEEGL